MELKEGLWGGLPSDLVECVLSFLPVLELCRLRSVCKGWNELICNAAFHDLCEQNRKENGYLFVIRHHKYLGWTEVDHRFKRTTSFLDLDSKRWYSLKPCGEVGAPRALRSRKTKSHWMFAMEHGLVCDVSVTNKSAAVFAISDPIARTRKVLPQSPACIGVGHAFPIIVTAADLVTRSYRVFVIADDDEEQDSRIFVYESATNKWRPVKSPPEPRDVGKVVSAVIFSGKLYVIFRVAFGDNFELLSFDPQEEIWEYNLWIPEATFAPGLVVSCNRLFVLMWVREWLASPVGPWRKFQLEVTEVLVAENVSSAVAHVNTWRFVKIFGDPIVTYFDSPFAVPCYSSSGSCESLVLMSNRSGKLVSIDLANRSLVALPAPPAESNESGEGHRDAFYLGKHTNLSLRNLSSPFLE